MRNATLGAVLLAAIPLAAHADTDHIFNVNGNYYEFDSSGSSFAGGSITGTETIDLTTGTIVGASLTSVDYGNTYFFTGAPVSQGLDYNTAAPDDPTGSPSAYDATFMSGPATLELNLSLYTAGPDYGYYPDLTTYAGGPVCSLNGYTDCSPGNYFDASFLNEPNAPNGTVYVNDGSLTPGAIVATPEPSSLVLLGSGVLGAAGAVRRRRG